MINLLVAENILSFKNLIQVEFNSSSVIYGKNGSGKTNLLWLIWLLKSLASGEYKSAKAFASTYEYRFKEQPSTITLGASFTVENHCYEILYQLNQNSGFIQQQLNLIDRKGKEVIKTCLFDSANESFPYLSHIELERVQTYIWSEKSLLAVFNNDFDLSDKKFQNHIHLVYRFFSEMVNWAVPSIQEAAERVYANDLLKQRIVLMLQTLGFCLSDIKIDRVMMPKIDAGRMDTSDVLSSGNQNVAAYSLQFEHLGKYAIQYHYESNGMVKLFCILSALLDEQNKNEVWLFDELENSLHEEIFQLMPLIVKEKVHGQIIFTSHNTLLLDMKILTKKQVIIILKDCDECSEVISLDDFTDLRTDSRNNWQRWYRQNRFGGYPEIDIDKILDLKIDEGRMNG